MHIPPALRAELAALIDTWIDEKCPLPDDRTLVVCLYDEPRQRVRVTIADEPEAVSLQPDSSVWARSVTELDLPTRVMSILGNAGIVTIGNLHAYGAERFVKLGNCGFRTLVLVRDRMQKLGIKLDRSWKLNQKKDRDWRPDIA